MVLREIRDGMIQAGLFRDAVQFRQQIGRIIADMECWDRLRDQRGAYRLAFMNGVA